ncbi:stage II sporulation protein R [Romboutsia sp.]|uniref:stage II sporulation protein R n=1 Tax=Romboutsia sp. TaxID=1965302 RepID=UPI003F376999
MRVIKNRLRILAFCLISLILIMTVVINGEIKKINAATIDYKEKLIRFHVIANSNSDKDQNLKLKVRDNVIAYLQPKLAKSESIQESERIIKSEYDNLRKVSEDTIHANGYNYGVTVDIVYSEFPTKQYSNVILPAGEYKALKIVIGSGQGRNWWCVMFPPLCFVDDEKGMIDKKTDEKLKQILTEEEYKLITQKSQDDVSRATVKFKVIEVLKGVF